MASGLAAAANGLALLDDPANARDPPRSPGIFVADYLPALVNALRVFLGVGATVLFWIVTEWSSGLQAVVFAAVTIMIFSPMQEKSGKAALGQGIGTGIAAIVAAVIKFAFLPNHEGFLAFSLIIAAALMPLGALSSVPLLAPYFTSATLNFVPLLAPTNEMTYDAAAFFNSALGLLSGCAVGGLALLLIPPVSTQTPITAPRRPLYPGPQTPCRRAPLDAPPMAEPHLRAIDRYAGGGRTGSAFLSRLGLVGGIARHQSATAVKTRPHWRRDLRHPGEPRSWRLSEAARRSPCFGPGDCCNSRHAAGCPGTAASQISASRHWRGR